MQLVLIAIPVTICVLLLFGSVNFVMYRFGQRNEQND